MAAFIGRAEAAKLLGVTEHQVVELSRRGLLGQAHRGPAGGFVWDRVAVLAYLQDRDLAREDVAR